MSVRNIFFVFLFALSRISMGNADDAGLDNVLLQSQSGDEILTRVADNTPCATKVFSDALRDTAKDVAATDSEEQIQEWIRRVFSAPDVLQRVLDCPEIATVKDDETITFLPIKWTFPTGREIVVNYETQPKILRSRLLLGNKRNLPVSGDLDSPEILPDDGNVWTNTNPAWYAIMVVQRGTLDNFVGPNKNNTISLDYIRDNIDRLYPSGGRCTSKSALANNSDMINRAVRNTVGIQDDTNDYYVAGDVNLQWISYAEIGLDVAITVATMGAGTAVMGTTKSARASRVLKNLNRNIRELSKSDNVARFIRARNKGTRLSSEISSINECAETMRKLQRTERELATATGSRKAKLTQEAADLNAKIADTRKIIGPDAAGITNPDDMLKLAESRNKQLGEINKSMRQMEQSDKEVKRFRESVDSYSEINKWRRNLRALSLPQRGNIIVRAWRAGRAVNTGGQALSRGARVARSGMKSGQVRDWLFNSTLSNLSALGRMERTGGLVYGTLKFLGGMYDWTETSTGDFTNDIEFMPLLLLSADDLRGQENVVNHGMWLMWLGDSTAPADDDAAFLQAMDAAEKFHQDLNDQQAQSNSYPCDVDIYVVRPIIRNPGTAGAKLYYLIMNDTPWSTTRATTNY